MCIGTFDLEFTQSNNICSKFENANQGKVLKFENSVQNRTFLKKPFEFEQFAN